MGKTQRIVGIILIVLACCLAAYAWVLGSRMAEEQKRAQPQLQPVVVAAAHISAGKVITPEMIKLVGFPVRPEGSYLDMSQVLGKMTASDLAAGEPLLRERVEGSVRQVMHQLEQGERAVAVRVDEVIAVGNRLSPGDFVDVYLTLRRNSDEISDTHARLLLEKVRILAMGVRDVVAPKEGGATVRNAVEPPKTAVLAVPSLDVDKLALAAESGRLLLALRPLPDKETPDSTAPGSEPGAPSKVAVTTPPAGAKHVLSVLTLRELINARKNDRPSQSAAAPSPAAESSGKRAIVVMHGLKEKSIYMDGKLQGAKQ